jgi:hypothetical protein
MSCEPLIERNMTKLVTPTVSDSTRVMKALKPLAPIVLIDSSSFMFQAVNNWTIIWH